jgi:hypothetical protein
MDFRPGSYRKKENPAQRIARENQGRLEGIIRAQSCGQGVRDRCRKTAKS